MSTITDIPEDVIKNSVVRTYFRNGKITPNDIDDLIHDFNSDDENSVPPEITAHLFGKRINKTDFMHLLLHKAKDLPRDKNHAFKERVNVLYAQLKEIYVQNGIDSESS